jgi:four helix bundle protein
LRILRHQIAPQRVSRQNTAGTLAATTPWMSTMFTYRDLETWKQAMDLVERCYRITGSLPTSELYGLTSQLRRAAVSIPSNVAEGHCRRSTKAYANHVSIALGSHGELATCIDLCARLGFLKQAEATRLLASSNSVGRLLNGLYRSLEAKLLHEPDHSSPDPQSAIPDPPSP